MPDINWTALLMVAGVSITATAAISVCMSLSNWFFTPVEGAEQPTAARRTLGIVMLVVMGVIILFGLYLMIPYFR